MKVTIDKKNIYGVCLLSLLLLTSACSSEQKPTKAIDNKKVDVNAELTHAIHTQDYRLYATSGRSITLPGISPDKFAQVSKRCGVKYMSGTGDVIKNKTQRAERKKLVNYMQQYNQQIVIHCKEHK